MKKGSRTWNALLVCCGLALLVGGAHLMVESGILIVRAVGLSEIVIRITLVALGTLLPELATFFVGALRAESDIMCVIGLVSMVTPLPVVEACFSLNCLLCCFSASRSSRL